MTTQAELKKKLRDHIEYRMNDFRSIDGCGSFYKDVAYGAVWAARFAGAISAEECDQFMAELNNKLAEAA